MSEKHEFCFYTLVCIFVTMENDKTSFRITFDKAVVDFMNDYKETHGATIQWFVERAVNERIQALKAQQTIEEIESIPNRDTIQ